MTSAALESIEAGLREDPRAALESIDALLAEHPSDSNEHVRALILRAMALFWMHDLVGCARAAARADRACSRLGDPPELRVRLARVLVNLLNALGMAESALETLDSALRQGPQQDTPETVVLQVNRASLLRSMGRTAQAARTFDALLQSHLHSLEPDPAAVLLINAASTWWQVDRLDDADAALSQARTLLAGHQTPLQDWIDVIRSWVAGARGERERAVELARGALERRADELDLASSAVRAWLGAAPSQGDGWDQARQACEQVMARCSQAARHGLAANIARELAERAHVRGDAEAEARYLREVNRAERERAAYAERQMFASDEVRLQVLSWQLESDALRARNAVLTERNARIEVLANTRAQLLKSVAHDLRSPLTALMLGLDALRHSSDHPVVDDLQQAATQMRSLLDHALSGQSIQVGEAEFLPVPTDITATVRDAVRAFLLPARRRGIAIEVNAPRRLVARVDTSSVRRIVHNVVSNAIKHSPNGGRVWVHLRRLEQAMELRVQDQGPGFPSNPERLLLSSARAADGTSDEGHGIGLHTVYRLATAHGGTVRLCDRDGGGAQVIVRLPTPE